MPCAARGGSLCGYQEDRRLLRVGETDVESENVAFDAGNQMESAAQEDFNVRIILVSTCLRSSSGKKVSGRS